MTEIVILILLLLAAFIGVAWYARRRSERRLWEIDLDHLEPEANLDNDFDDYFEHELQQHSIDDIDSEPVVKFSTTAEKLAAERKPARSSQTEKTHAETAQPSAISAKKAHSTIQVVIDDDIDAIEETPTIYADDIEPIQAIEPKPTTPKPARKASDDLVIALTIMAAENEQFSGRAIKAALESSNLNFGDLQIYHRFTAGARKQSIFSVANILDPGTLLPDKFTSLTTPGLLIFARLPGPVNGLAVFDDLLETAQSLTQKLGGTLSDDARKPINESRLEDMRRQIFHLNFAIHNEKNDYSS